MTAVAPPPNFQPISRTWGASNGSANGLNTVSADDVSRMFMPRKSAQRSNSSSSLSSQASSNSTISASSVQTTAGAPTTSDSSGWGTRKRPARGLWPPSKAEPVSGLTTARSQSVPSSSSGPSAASAISALHSPHPGAMLPSQNGGHSQTQQNGISRAQGQPENPAILHLSPMNGTFERKTITVPFYPEVLRIGRQTNTKTIPTATNGYFDSKVLSRQHAEVWADRNGKIWIRDVKSSNGTFVNGQRLSQENRDSDPHELHEQDMLELGIDIVSEDQKTVVHHKVAAKVEHAGFYNTDNVLNLNFGDLDPSMNAGMMSPISPNFLQGRGRAGSQGSIGSNGRLGSAASSAAGSNMSAIAQQRYNQMWLTPISMEQVAKKLTNELKQAKKYGQDLEQSAQIIGSLLLNEQPKEVGKHSGAPVKPMKGDLKARFSDPPAPPPQQPLPEKPDVSRSLADSVLQPILKRSDTEKPKLASSGSPSSGEPSKQLTSLAEELAHARKELDSKTVRVKELEDMIEQERLARESAEERAQRLEMERKEEGVPVATPTDANHVLVNGVHEMEATREAMEGTREPKPTTDEPVPSEDADIKATSLQQRLDQMVAAMEEMKHTMEQFKVRAETAEVERDTARQSLADMVEKLRQDEADRATREARDRRRSKSRGNNKGSTHLDGAAGNGVLQPFKPMENGFADAMLRKAGVVEGRPVTPEQVTELAKEMTQALSTRPGQAHLAQAAPFASMLSVVILGVGLMAYLNSWQKVER